MKRTTYFLTLLSAVLLMAGCKKKDYAELNKPGTGPLAITASKQTVVLKEKEGLQDALAFNWTTGTNEGSDAAITYSLQLAKGGTNFSPAISMDMGRVTYTRKFNVKDLNDSLLTRFNAAPGVAFPLEARVIARPAGGTAQTSAPITIQVTPYAPVSPTLYLVGDATTAGWNNNAPVAMTAVAGNPGSFRWTGQLSAGEFKFLTTVGQWLPSYNKGATANKLVKRTDFAQPDDKFVIANGGVYLIEVDLIDLTIAVSQPSQPPYSRLWVVGSATPNGWNINSPNEMQVDSSNRFVFKYNEVLSAGEFKIPTATGNWGTDYYMPVVNAQPLTSTAVQLVPGGSPDNKWVITNPGPYKIRLDLLNMTINIRPFTPYTQLWLVGDATPAGWNINAPTPMVATAGNPYEFTWTGPMTPGEFKIPTATGNWGTDYFMPLVDQQGTGSKLAKFVPSGNPDHKWRISTAGTYKITFNQLKETIDIVRQ